MNKRLGICILSTAAFLIVSSLIVFGGIVIYNRTELSINTHQGDCSLSNSTLDHLTLCVTSTLQWTSHNVKPLTLTKCDEWFAVNGTVPCYSDNVDLNYGYKPRGVTPLDIALMVILCLFEIVIIVVSVNFIASSNPMEEENDLLV